jgi:hypothetical protein
MSHPELNHQAQPHRDDEPPELNHQIQLFDNGTEYI